jgi:hypothetical protein
MKIPTISIVMTASILLVGCGKKSDSSGIVSSPVIITNPVVSTNSIWAQQRRADEQASASGDLKAAERVCIGNLRQIDGAKNMWVIQHKKQKGDVPTEADLMEYMPPGQSFPVCPSGGTYVINAVGVLPTCSIPGHAIPATR